MRIGLRIYKEFEKGPEIEKVTCLKNNQSIYDPTKDEYRIYEYEMPIWCPSIDGKKLEKITNDINSVEIND